MKGKNENKLDQLFKDGLSGSEDHIAFREEDWASMERLLDNKPSKKAVLLRRIYYASGIAALLLLAIGLFFLNKDNDKVNPKQDKVYSKTKPQVKGNNDQTSQPLKKDSAANGTIGSNERLGSSGGQSHGNKAGLPLSVDRNGRYLPGSLNKPTETPVIAKITKDTAKNDVAGNTTNNLTVTPDKVASANNQTQNNLVIVTTPPDTTTDATTAPVQQVKKDKASLKPILRRGPRFSLSILAAPDLNAVNSFSRNQVGTNLGFQLAIHVSKKFSVSAGAAYAIKPYQTGSGQYNSAVWSGKVSSDLPTNVAANCKVLDIPINLSYQFYSKGKNSFALGTGLSSYIMLRENYHFDFNDGSGRPSYDIQIDNRNQHILGVLNLNATYERKINSKFSTVIQPYMKLPLTGIGNGRVDLKSTGVAVGISWNINSVLRPK